MFVWQIPQSRTRRGWKIYKRYTNECDDLHLSANLFSLSDSFWLPVVCLYVCPCICLSVGTSNCIPLPADLSVCLKILVIVSVSLSYNNWICVFILTFSLEMLSKCGTVPKVGGRTQARGVVNESSHCTHSISRGVDKKFWLQVEDRLPELEVRADRV